MNKNFNISNIKVIHYSNNNNDPFPDPIQLVLEGYDIQTERDSSKLVEFAFYTTHDIHIAQNMVVLLKSKKVIASDLLKRWGFILPKLPEGSVTAS